MKSILIPLLLPLLLAAGGAQAATLESFDFGGAVSEQRFKSLIGELRCMVCQNESLAGSNAELAQDLRNEVYQLMSQGQSDEQIVDFLVTRYSDFVLYNPPLRPSTYLLWFGPFVFLLLAAIVLIYSVSKRSRSPEPQLSNEQQARIEKLLSEAPPPKDEHS
ncbi:MAG: cytochrome c-type biogenesis protein CcmH [Gammaproteobacteria bacterium]|nr:cytochrome c-type biogenesis protein CcmH [Gammaproteobacteria bacterium]